MLLIAEFLLSKLLEFLYEVLSFLLVLRLLFLFAPRFELAADRLAVSSFNSLFLFDRFDGDYDSSIVIVGPSDVFSFAPYPALFDLLVGFADLLDVPA